PHAHHHRHVLSYLFHDSAKTEYHNLSLHDALPIYWSLPVKKAVLPGRITPIWWCLKMQWCKSTWSMVTVPHTILRCRNSMWNRTDRKSTRLNSSHVSISYAVFCLKKKKARKHSHSH